MDLRILMLLKAAGGEAAVEKIAVGNPVAFTAGLSKMLKKLAVPLMCSQPGSGDPSLANVRPVYGVNGFFVVQSGKNMAYLRGYSAANRGYDLDGVLSNSYGTTISTTDPVRSLVITQSDSTADYDKHNYRNGYLSIRTDNMVPGIRYDVSFRVTDIVSNPLNASLSDLQLLAGSGTGSMASEIVGDTVIWRNFAYREAATYRQAWELRNCGMSFTLSDFLITPAGTTDGVYEPYTGGRLDIAFPQEVGPVFGGVLDVVSGELTITYAECKTTWGAGTNSKVFTANERRRITLPFTCIGAASAVSGACNVASWDWDYEKDSPHFYTHNGYSYVFLPVGTDDSMEIQIVGKLAEPVTVQLTPEQTAVIKGINTFWTDTLGDLSVVYLDKR